MLATSDGFLVAADGVTVADAAAAIGAVHGRTVMDIASLRGVVPVGRAGAGPSLPRTLLSVICDERFSCSLAAMAATLLSVAVIADGATIVVASPPAIFRFCCALSMSLASSSSMAIVGRLLSTDKR